MTPQQFNDWRLAPRLLVIMYGIVCWQTFTWFTGLPAPTTQQVTFASTIWGAAGVWFGFYVNSGGRSGAD